MYIIKNLVYIHQRKVADSKKIMDSNYFCSLIFAMVHHLKNCNFIFQMMIQAKINTPKIITNNHLYKLSG
jgi:hypothetical protein